MSPLPTSPLILTLTLDSSTHTFLTSLRTRYFPSHRNHLAAHLTLFHAIPPRRLAALDKQLRLFCERPGFDIVVSPPRRMGNRGVMLGINSVKPVHAIEGMHRALLSGMKKDQAEHGADEGDEEGGGLTNQDLMKLAHPHVTILNKADEEEDVERCLSEVTGMFSKMDGGERRGRAVGFEL